MPVMRRHAVASHACDISRFILIFRLAAEYLIADGLFYVFNVPRL